MKNTKRVKVLAASLFLVLGLTVLSGCSSIIEEPTAGLTETWNTVTQSQ